MQDPLIRSLETSWWKKENLKLSNFIFFKALFMLPKIWPFGNTALITSRQKIVVGAGVQTRALIHSPTLLLWDGMHQNCILGKSSDHTRIFSLCTLGNYAYYPRILTVLVHTYHHWNVYLDNLWECSYNALKYILTLIHTLLTLHILECLFYTASNLSDCT